MNQGDGNDITVEQSSNLIFIYKNVLKYKLVIIKERLKMFSCNKLV